MRFAAIAGGRGGPERRQYLASARIIPISGAESGLRPAVRGIRRVQSTAVPLYSVGQAAELLGVSPDSVRRLADRGEVRTVRTPGGRRRLDGADLAAYAQRSAAPRLSGRTTAQSARNQFAGLVTKVTKDKVMAQVEVQAGPFRVVSLISREAADELGLTPGSLVVTSVKSTNVVVEIPQTRSQAQ
jgi:molybdopterin-binding protein